MLSVLASSTAIAHGGRDHADSQGLELGCPV